MSRLKQNLGYLLLFACTVLQTGCCAKHYFHQRETQYLTSCEAPPLRVPVGTSCANIGSDYAIPPVAAPKPCEPVCILPPR